MADWSVFEIHPDGTFTRVERGMQSGKAITRARQLWAASQDDGTDRTFAPGLCRPAQELAEQEVEQERIWRDAGCLNAYQCDQIVERLGKPYK